MSISNQALQKVGFSFPHKSKTIVSHYVDHMGWSITTWQLVQEIEAQALLAQQQINVVKSQISVKQRDIRLLELTSSEVATLPRDTNVYEGIGKM